MHEGCLEAVTIRGEYDLHADHFLFSFGAHHSLSPTASKVQIDTNEKVIGQKEPRI